MQNIAFTLSFFFLLVFHIPVEERKPDSNGGYVAETLVTDLTIDSDTDPETTGPANTIPYIKPTQKVDMYAPSNTTNQSIHQDLLRTNRYVNNSVINFEFDHFDLKNAEDFNIILSLADKLLFNKALKVSLSGFTDNIGTAGYNEVLSYKRVENIKSYLIEIGVPESQIITSFNSFELPTASNDTEDGRAANRRVEMLLFS